MKANQQPEAWRRSIEVLRPVLLLAPRTYLGDVRERLTSEGISAAVKSGHTPPLFDWIVRLLARQGIGNHAAEVFLARRGSPTFDQIGDLLAKNTRCPRLRGWWSFEGCSYRRSAASCAIPHHHVGCPVTSIPARKGSLAEAAVGLWMFIRDCCDGDLVGWIDRRLAEADRATGDERLERMRAALIKPLREIPGTGPKVWSMILAELLLGADQQRSLWVETGASIVAVDSLVHAILHRTGVLRRLNSDHAYGPACHEPGGCASVIEALAQRIDAREFAPKNPANFPRLVQFALWWFAAAGGWDICNANRIDDRVRCRQLFCPCYPTCDRMLFGRGLG